jgi:Cellulase (glycosyl hydrolase family 5)
MLILLLALSLVRVFGAPGHHQHPKASGHAAAYVQPRRARGDSSIPAPQPAGAVSAMNGLTLYMQPREWSAQLGLMESNGVAVVRSDAPWATVQPQPASPGPVYRFASLDAWVKALARHHLTWLPIIDDTPWWAKRCPGMCPPMNLSWYTEFAHAVAARYGPTGSFWSSNPRVPYYPVKMFEIWNEENGTQFWSTGPSAYQYARMYSESRKAIDSVDPAAQVIVGGLGAGDAGDFVEDMLITDRSLRGNIDGIGFHPYASDAAGVEGLVAQFRAKLEQIGEGSVPIEVTEFGWTSGDNAQQQWRARMMQDVAAALANSNCGVSTLAPYTWANDPGLPPDFALVQGTELTPSAEAWFSGLAAAEDAAKTSTCAAPPQQGLVPPIQTILTGKR